MTDREVKLVLGSLLHDIGKVIYRQGDDRRKHSQSGYDFLKNEVHAEECDTDILDCVRYHHADAMMLWRISSILQTTLHLRRTGAKILPKMQGLKYRCRCKVCLIF